MEPRTAGNIQGESASMLNIAGKSSLLTGHVVFNVLQYAVSRLGCKGTLVTHIEPMSFDQHTHKYFIYIITFSLCMLEYVRYWSNILFS